MKELLLMMMCMVGMPLLHAEEKKVLVAYFSCTGHTETAAKALAQATHGTLYKIQPKQAYTAADLDWNNNRSRSSREMNDDNARPALTDKAAKADTYDVIFLGFPIWWDLPPRIINSFVEAYQLKGKTVIPFATSGGSSIANSVNSLKEKYPAIHWQNGQLINGGASQALRWGKTALSK